MKNSAICLKCGDWKAYAQDPCKTCGFKPEKGTTEEIKSAYLAIQSSNIEEQQENREREKLSQLQKDIKQGKPVTIPEQIYARLEEEREFVNSMTKLALLKILFEFFRPAIILLIILSSIYAVILFLK